MFLEFPKNFLWGASTSAHQIEGNNNNDWTEWEKKNSHKLSLKAMDKWRQWQKDKFPEMFDSNNYESGRACDSYNLYENDFDLAKEIGLNAHRFSVEWSRIEPKEGQFDDSELEHYRNVIMALKKRGIEPFVALWHWTLPIWLAKKGGVLNINFPDYFSRYVKRVVLAFKGDVKFWITLNEPTSLIGQAYLSGNWPPQKHNIISVFRAYSKLAQAHNKAYDAIHLISPKALVSLANILSFIEPYNPKSLLDRTMSKYVHFYTNEKFYALTKGKHDFIAIQYYFHRLVDLMENSGLPQEKVSDMGWEICPQGIYKVLNEVKKYNLPVYITENGLADKDDTKRAEFIKNHLIWVHKAISEGVDVRGYFYWSLLDNFEWDKGFWPRFGLVEVDYKNQKRTIRKSASVYKSIILKNGLEFD